MTDQTQALPHGNFQEVFKDIYLVSGKMSIKGRLPLSFSRNMTVIRQSNDLVLINSVRLNDSGLAELKALGTVKHVIRLAGFHGMDDAFYKERYGAKVWSVNAPYFKGVDFNIDIQSGYFQADSIIDDSTALPINGSKAICINSSNPKELLLFLEREGGILISGDALQNWAKPDQFFNLPAKIMMRLMGFIKPCNIGPAWLKHTRPETSDLKQIIDCQFEHLIPAHGNPVIGNAKEKFLPAFSRL